MKKVVVSLRGSQDSRWKSWRKLVTGFNRDNKGGYKFDGSWLPLPRRGETVAKVELTPGDFVMLYDERGSTKYHSPDVEFCRVCADGVLEQVAFSDGWNWAIDIQDAVEAAFKEKNQLLGRNVGDVGAEMLTIGPA